MVMVIWDSKLFIPIKLINRQLYELKTSGTGIDEGYFVSVVTNQFIADSIADLRVSAGCRPLVELQCTPWLVDSLN